MEGISKGKVVKGSVESVDKFISAILTDAVRATLSAEELQVVDG